MTLRDRTNEFFAVAETEARRRKPRGTAPTGAGGNSSDGQNSVTEPLLAGGSSSSRFEALDEMRARQPPRGTTTFTQDAGQIGKEIASVSTKLERLTKLAKAKSLFDEDTRTAEIQQMTVVINADIKALNERIAELQKRSDSKKKTDTQQHVDTVVGGLKSKLKIAAKRFSDVLELRTESLKSTQKNREAFTGNASRLPGTPKAAFADGPGISSSLSHRQGAVPSFADSPMYSSSVAIQMPPEAGGFTMSSQMVAVQDRTEVVRGIESTIVELQGIFQQLASLVAEQGEMIERIDSTVDESVVNVDRAQSELLQYL